MTDDVVKELELDQKANKKNEIERQTNFDIFNFLYGQSKITEKLIFIILTISKKKSCMNTSFVLSEMEELCGLGYIG